MLGANNLSAKSGQLPKAAKTVRFKWSKFWLQLFLIVGSVFMAYPLIYVLLASFSTQRAFTNSTWIPIPDSLFMGNYTRFFSGAGQEVGTWVFNTLIRVGWYILVPGTIAILCGYVFARLQFRGRDTVFIILLSSMMVPPIVFLIPTYIMLARTPLAGGNDFTGQGGHGFVNEWPALLLPGLVNAFYIFFMRQSIQTIPADFEEAARVDGANTVQVIINIYLPMLKAAMTVLVIFQSVAIWNDYLWPLIAVSGNRSIYPVALGFQKLIQFYTQTNSATSYPTAFTLGAIATIPTIVLFLFLQRYFIEGVQGFGLKG
jgi:multiple sugar transport system permease protein